MAWTEEELNQLLKKGNVHLEDDQAPKQDPVQTVHDPVFRTLENVRSSGSGVEYSFAASYLEGRVEDGTSIGWAYEPLIIRMVGHTYTPDFIEWGADGITRFYEVKGAKKIPSQDRSSAKYRFTAALFESDIIQFFWAKQRNDGTFKPKKLPKQGKRDKPKMLRENDPK